MDPRSRRDLRDILRELHHLGKTILISSHLLRELTDICTHLGIMRNGEMVAEGSTDEIMDAVSAEAHLRLTLLNQANRDRARRILEESLPAQTGSPQDYLSIADDGESSLLIHPGGTRLDVGALIEQLIRHDVRISEFALVRPTLEDVVLQVTDAKVEV
jgi:ABC-2 type transport system ATP-binding protein